MHIPSDVLLPLTLGGAFLVASTVKDIDLNQPLGKFLVGCAFFGGLVMLIIGIAGMF
jgi:hypothetical protein